MTSACTLILPRLDYLLINQFISNSVYRNGEPWTQQVITKPAGKLKLTIMVWQEGGDPFSKMRLGMDNYFRVIQTTATANQKLILDRIDVSDWAIGVVADPEFKDADERADLVFALAKATDALIFTGDAMLDAEGHVLLDSQGKYEIRLK